MTHQDQYQCARCGGVFSKDCTDETAIESALKDQGPTIFQEPCVVVCDDCFKAIKQIELERKRIGNWEYPQN